MTKKINHSMRIAQNIPVVFEDYRDMQTMEMKPCSGLFLERLAEDMTKWVDESEDNLVISQFFHSRKINVQNLYRWLPKSESLREAHSYVMARLGSRREVGALKKEYDSGMVRTTMPHYDKVWKDLEEWRSKLREPTESGDKVVVIERFPDVPSVPERKKE
jgi:hypothetical protein